MLYCLEFRVFMLYDPSRGDISRAMRNRGVEIYVPTVNEVKLSEEDRYLKGHHAFLMVK